MAAAFVQALQGTTASSSQLTSIATSAGSAFGAGNYIVGSLFYAHNVAGASQADISSITDGTNTYTIIDYLVDTDSNTSGTAIFFGPAHAGATTITVNFAGAGEFFPCVQAHEISGVAGTTDGHSQVFRSNVASTAQATPSITTTVNGDYVYACLLVTNNGVGATTVNSPFTLKNDTTGNNQEDAFDVQGTAAAISATFNITTTGAGQDLVTGIIALKAAVAFIPRRRRSKKSIRRNSVRRHRSRTAAYIGSITRLAPPSHVWNWNKQAPVLNLALGTISKAWVWAKNAAVISSGIVAFIPFRRKRKPYRRRPPRLVRRKKIAPFIGSITRLAPPSQVWNWAKNAPTFSLVLGTVSKAWVWAKNAAIMNLALGTVSKAWTWTKNAPSLGQALGTVSKAWAWSANAAVLTFNAGLLLTSRQWQWIHRGAVLSIKTGSALYNIMRGVMRGVVRKVAGSIYDE